MSAPAPRLAPADRLAIVELIARYNWAIDTRDADAFAATFTADGAFVDSGEEPIRGPEQLRGMVAAIAQSPRAAGLQHWTANLVVLEAAGDRAVVKAYMMGPLDAGEGAGVGVVGFYVDTLVKASDGWRFEQRCWQPWDAEAAAAADSRA